MPHRLSPQRLALLLAALVALLVACSKSRDEQPAVTPNVAPSSAGEPSPTAAAQATASVSTPPREPQAQPGDLDAGRRAAPGSAKDQGLADDPARPDTVGPRATATATPPAALPSAGGEPKGKGSPVTKAPSSVQGQDRPLDPSGRYATTYRPGHGHLAAFEAAVARGVVPASEREVVADVGSRSAPELALSVGKAITVKTEIERAKLPPTGGPFHMRIALRSTPERGAERPRLAVHLVVDTSGSMAGAPIAQARAAAQALVDKLEPNDEFSLVTFSSDARVVIPVGPVGERRALVARQIRSVREGGNTNIGRGLELAYREATRRTAPDEAIPLVLLLSDGKATAGTTDSVELTRLALEAFHAGVQTSTFGLGSAFDGSLMSALAQDGAGAYYYLRDPSQIAAALGTEIDRRVDPVATAVEVRVWLEPNVELLRVYGSRRLGEEESNRVRSLEIAADRRAASVDGIERDRRDDIEGGMRFYIPAFARDDAHAMLFKLRAPRSGTGPLRIGVVELKYKDRVFGKNVFEDTTLWAEYAPTVEESSRTLNLSVARSAAAFAAGEALVEAASLVARSDRSAAVALLAEREGVLRDAARALDDPGLFDDARRIARIRDHASSAQGLGQPLVLAMLLETAGMTRLR